MNRSLNHTYRLVWSHLRQALVPVAEGTSSQGKQSRTAKRALGIVGGSLLLAGTPALAATASLPSGGTVAGGEGSIADDGTHMTITQTSDRLAVNWDSFSVGSGNSVTFDQPSASAVALNRVLGSSVSTIQGAINANGQVFLVNPNGVTFSSTAQVNVGGLVASTLDISVDDFMAGNYTFAGDSTATVSNAGKINAAGGTIALIAAKVTNVDGGELSAEGGDVFLAAGSRVALDLGGPVTLEVQSSVLDALVEQGGAIYAGGGRVYLTAKAAGDVAATVINQTGVIEATSLATGESGEIVLLGNGGKVAVGGTLDASAGEGLAAGSVSITANGSNANVDINAATVQAGDVSIYGYAESGDGVSLTGSSVVAQGDGNLTISGKHSEYNSAGNGVTLTNTTLRNETGALSVYGEARYSSSTGISIDSASQVLSSAGEIVIEGHNYASYNPTALSLDGQVGAAAGSAVTDSSADVALLANNLSVGSNALLTSTGTLTISRATYGTMAIDSDYYPTSYFNVPASLIEGSQIAGFSEIVLGGESVYTLYVNDALTLPRDAQLLSAGSVYIANDVTTAHDLAIGHSGSYGTGYDYQVYRGHSVSFTDPANQTFRLGAWNDLDSYDYTLIATDEQLRDVVTGDLSGRYALADDIDMSAITDFAAIGSDTGAFSGTFVGLGNTVSGLTLSAAADNQGLFGVTDGALIRNLEVADFDVTGLDHVAALVGQARNSRLYANRVEGGTVNGVNAVGGMVGLAVGSTIDTRGSDWYVKNDGGTVNASGNAVGNLVGQMDGGQLYQAGSSGIVNATGQGTRDIGGLVGLVEGEASLSSLESSATLNTVDGQTNIGGLVGRAEDAMLSSVSASGTVNAAANQQAIGGLVGRLSDATLSYSSASTTLVGADNLTDVGGLVGYSENGSVLNSYRSGALDVSSNAATNVGGLIGFNEGQVTRSYLHGNVTAEGSNIGGLVGRNGGSIDESYVQYAIYNSVSYNNNATKSSQDITLAATGASQNVGGLVGLNSGGAIAESYVDMTVAASGSSNVGGLVGANLDGGTIANSYALAVDSIASGDADADILGSGRSISGDDSVGGLVGYNDAEIAYSYAAAKVAGNSSVGGLVGSAGSAATVGGAFWDTTVSGLTDSAGGEGHTTAELKQRETYLNAGWDLSNVGGDGTTWRIYDDSDMYTDAYNGQARPLLRTFLTRYQVGSNINHEFDGSSFDWVHDSNNSSYGNDNQIYNPDTNAQIYGNGVLGRIVDSGDYSARNAGTYELEFNGDYYSHQHGYDIVYNQQATTTVTPRRLYVNVTPGAAESKVYDGTTTTTVTPASVTRYSLDGGDFVAGDDVQLSGSGTGRFATANVGSGISVYADASSFGLTGADAANYRFVGTLGTLSADITARDVTVTADDQSRQYGDTNPTLTWQASAQSGDTGLVAGDTFYGTLSSTGQGSAIGDYAIGQGSLNNGNYNITFEGGTLTVTKRAVTVKADELQKVYGESDPILSWHLSEGSLYGADTLQTNLSRAAGNDVGAYVVSGSAVDGSGNYTVSFENGSLTITPRPLKVVVDPKTKTYGEFDPALSYRVEGQSHGRGLLAGDAMIGSVSREQGEGIGRYVIGQGDLAAPNANYALGFTAADLIITRRAISLAADLVTKYYGDADPTLSVSITGGSLANASVSDSLANLVGTLTRESGRDVGEYDIRLGHGARAGNYAITFDADNDALTIAPRLITVTADSLSRYVGRPDPALTWQVTEGNLVAGDSLPGMLMRDSGKVVGNYTIHQGSVGDGNYAITFVDGNLEILADPTPLRTAQVISRGLQNVQPPNVSPTPANGPAATLAQGPLQLVEVGGSEGTGSDGSGNTGDSQEVPFIDPGMTSNGPLQVFVVEGGISLPRGAEGSSTTL